MEKNGTFGPKGINTWPTIKKSRDIDFGVPGRKRVTPRIY